MRGVWRMDSWVLDVRLGIRMLLKYPGLTLTGAFGIAVAVAIASGAFSIIYGNFLAVMPLVEGERMVSLEMWNSAASQHERRILREYQGWREGLQSVTEISAFRTLTPNLITGDGQGEIVRVAAMSASGFRVARVKPLMGRFLEDADERDGATAVAVIGEGVWRNRFGADAGILGKTMRLGSATFAIVGVMPQGFAFPVNHHFWIPLRTENGVREPLAGPEVMVFGRLAAAATLGSAQAEADAQGRREALAFPKIYGQMQARVLPYPNPFLGLHSNSDVTGLLATNFVVIMLLVLVCLNVAILVYTRTAMRQGEISVRTALGASRRRIVTQMFIEALVLSTVGTAAGVGLAAFALRQMEAAIVPMAGELPYWLKFDLPAGAVIYAGALSVMAAAIVGILPALQATGGELQTRLRGLGGGGGTGMDGTWTFLIVAQVGFATALLPAAAYAVWENLRVEVADSGIAVEQFLTAQVGIEDMRAAGGAAMAPRSETRQTELLRRLGEDVRVSGATFSMAAMGDEPGGTIETDDGATHHVRYNRVDVQFFAAVGAPLLAGRGFSGAERAAVVVNQSFAQRVFGGQALGRRIRYSHKDEGGWYEIAGVVKDFPNGVSPGMNDSPMKVYHALATDVAWPVQVAVRIRSGAPATFSRRLREVAAGLDEDLQVRNIVTLEEALRKEQWIRRLEAAVLGAVAVSVLLLSSAGIYSLMSFTVSQRRKEIGIRIALGASRTRIVGSIFRRALAQLFVGAAVGMAFAGMMERSSEEGLMRGHAGVVLPVVALTMMAVGFASTLGPVRRCLDIEPVEALRDR